jgi:hypothetical protein
MDFRNLSNCFLFFLLLIFTSPLFAQETDDELLSIKDRVELSLTLGANNFEGDLGGTPGIGGTFKDYTLKTIKPLVGISASYNLSYSLAVRAGFNYTGVEGADSLITNTGDQERWRIYRNLSFKSSISEGYIALDIYPVMLFDKQFTIHQVAPFLSVGAGIFHFNPQANLNGTWIDLQPLYLEGECFSEYPDRQPYKLTQVFIPVSIGLKYYFDNKLAVSGGLNMRHTFTDYIDDISTTYIDPNLFDKYLTPQQAALAKQLYSRSIRPEKVSPGVEKAHSNNKDTYLTFFVTLSLRMGEGVKFYYGR